MTAVRREFTALLAASCIACGHNASPAATGGGMDGGGGGLDAHFEAAPLMDANFPPGPPGCGLDAAAFCDTFDHPASTTGRAGELDSTHWSGGRLFPQLPTNAQQPFPIMPATVPTCRAGLGATAFPDKDTLVCDPSADINSAHLLVMEAAQNYGENSYRIRQPFDFSNRTGKIVFDAEAYNVSLLGWISIDVTEDPIPVPNFGILMNDEGAVIPQNAFEVQFNACSTNDTSPTGSFGVAQIQVFQDYVDSVYAAMQPTCLPSAQGKLSHFEVDVSQTRVDVYATPVSMDGVTFAPKQLLYGADVNIPFARGYVHITTHNHATIKYSPNHAMRSWSANWDNVGFDGPAVSIWREYEIPDSLVPYSGSPFGFDGFASPEGSMNVGYLVADTAQGPNAKLHFQGVDLTNVVGARIALSAWYDVGGTLAQYSLRYRLNGGAWHDRTFTSAELAMIPGPKIVQGSNTMTGGMQGAFGQMLDVPVSELVSGDNTVEFVTANIPQSYPPAVSNIDLVLTTSQ